MKKLADVLYKWLLEEGQDFVTYFTRPEDPRGLNICLFIMLTVSFGAAAFYYWGVASKVNSATKANYLWTYLFGYIVLFLFTPLLFQLIFRNEGCDVMSFWIVFVKIGLINLVYYTIVYQLCSSFLCTTPWTKAKNITLFTAFK